MRIALKHDHASKNALGRTYGELQSLLDITEEGAAEQQRAAEAGAVEAVVAVLRTHPQEEVVQDLGGWALACICGHSEVQVQFLGSTEGLQTQRAGRRQRAVEAGAVETLVAALRAYPQVQTVQSGSCWALSSICAGSDGAAETRRQRAEEAGAVEAVMVALRTYPLVEDVQIDGLWTLSHICHGKENAAEIRRQRAVETGALEAVLAGITAHSQFGTYGECPRAGCHALMSLCDGGTVDLCDGGTGNAADDRRQQAVEAGALEAVVAAMFTHPEEEVQHEGCWALHAICWVPNDEARREQHGGRMQRAAEAGALEAVAAAVLAHEHLGYMGRLTLANICSGEDDAAGLRRQRAAELL